jgi:hypothetical protein
MEFKEVQQSPTWDFEESPVVQGKYIAKKENVGENHSNIYTLQQDDNNTVGVWGSTVLDGKMANVGIGQVVQIKFLGSKPSPKRAGKTYKDFAVFVGEE